METNIKQFHPEQNIFHYNYWSHFENREIRDSFTPLTKSEVENLKPGDLVWSNDEPYGGSGKIYGLTAHEIDLIEPKGEDFSVYFKNSTTSFFLWSSNWPLYKIKDPEKLKKLIESNPECLG